MPFVGRQKLDAEAAGRHYDSALHRCRDRAVCESSKRRVAEGFLAGPAHRAKNAPPFSTVREARVVSSVVSKLLSGIILDSSSHDSDAQTPRGCHSWS